MLSKKEIKLNNSFENQETNIQKLIIALSQVKKGNVNIIIIADDDIVLKAKKRYFAMVSELGKWLGYQSYKERELFKEQIKVELGNESIGDIREYDEIRIKIEELHQFALNEHNYKFPSNDTGIFFKDY